MKLDVSMLTHDLKTLPDYARKVEAMGYDCLWSSETQHDPYLPVAVAATSTSRIKLGTNIATVFSRSPMITAHIAWDLQKASAGRFTLGLGTQVKAHNERRFSVKFESPGPKMAEAIRAIRAIWDCWQNGTKLNFKGQFYTFDVMTPFFNPGPIEHPKIPIYIAAVNPLMCRIAGELCDGMHVHPFNSPEVPPRDRPPGGRGGAQALRALAQGLHLRDGHVRGGGRHREGAGRAGPDRQAADRLLRLHAHLPAGAGRARLGGSSPASSTASRWRATGRAWPTSSPTRCSTPTR